MSRSSRAEQIPEAEGSVRAFYHTGIWGVGWGEAHPQPPSKAKVELRSPKTLSLFLLIARSPEFRERLTSRFVMDQNFSLKENTPQAHWPVAAARSPTEEGHWVLPLVLHPAGVRF